jgi:hypothetical protein
MKIVTKLFLVLCLVSLGATLTTNAQIRSNAQDKIGDTYFLSKVFLEGDDGGNQLLKSKMQRRLEENGSIAESHSIAASPALAKSSKRAVR